MSLIDDMRNKSSLNKNKNLILKAFGIEDSIEKARSGVYANTHENRKLGRVGRHYGGKKMEENDKMNYKFDNEKQYFVRYSNHINEDLKRGWSSWNFGNEGIKAKSSYEIKENLDKLKENGGGNFYVSGFDFWIDEESKIKATSDEVSIIGHENVVLRELYPNYWVVVDNENTKDGLSAHKLPDKLNDLKEALNEINSKKGKYDGTGEGQSFNASDAKVIYSKDNMHIIEVG